MQFTDLDKPIDELVATQPHATALQEVQAELVLAGAVLKRRKETFDALLMRLFGDKATEAYRIAKKDTGTVYYAASNTLNLKIERDKDVKWDQATLRATLDAMSPQDARHYGKVSVEVEEKKFSAAPPAIQNALARARTVKPGRTKFSFVSAKEVA